MLKKWEREKESVIICLYCCIWCDMICLVSTFSLSLSSFAIQLCVYTHRKIVKLNKLLLISLNGKKTFLRTKEEENSSNTKMSSFLFFLYFILHQISMNSLVTNFLLFKSIFAMFFFLPQRRFSSYFISFFSLILSLDL